MNRRRFLASTGAAALLAAQPATSASAEPSPNPVLFKLGDQTAPTNDTHLKYLARYGVRNICGYPQIAGDRLYATVDELRAMIDLAAKYKISIDCTDPPFLTSSFIDTEKHPAIMLAQSPERDRDIEAVQTLIRNCAQAGIPCIKYNMSILGVLRTGRIPGRGDEMDSYWKLSEMHPNLPLTRAGHVDADAFWERITYFLDRVIPVANEYKIRMACHPQDPGVPPTRRPAAARGLKVHAKCSTRSDHQHAIPIRIEPVPFPDRMFISPQHLLPPSKRAHQHHQ